MGHFSHNCKLTGLPITGSTPVVLIPMKPVESLYDNSHEELLKYGSTYMCSNDGPRLKFIPCWFPIIGEYDEYGGIENIQKDANTKALEEYFELTIEEIAGIITCGRKDDGFSDELSIIKKPIEYPEDWIKGETHYDRFIRITGGNKEIGRFDVSFGGEKPWAIWKEGKKVNVDKDEYDAVVKANHEQYKNYQEWSKTNPNVEDDYGKPQYKERYTELLNISGMWIHGEVYKRLVAIEDKDYYERLELGTPQILTALGFVENGKSSDERYKRVFEKDGLKVNSDGTWINVPQEHIYRLPDFKKYCAKHNVEIDIDEMKTKTRVHQVLDYIVPSMDSLTSLDSIYKYILDKVDKGEMEMPEKLKNEDLSIFKTALNGQGKQVAYYLLNGRSDYGLKNKMTEVYFNKIKTDPSLKQNVIDFWKFDSYMYATGNYYEIVGTSPQDGDHKSVMEVISIAKDIMTEIMEERSEWDNIDEEDE